jgi:hypothetical protein
MKAKHPAYYIMAGIAIVLSTIAAVQGFLHLYHKPLFWELLITILAGAIVLLIVSLLLYTRKINPQTNLLPPPFGQ